MSTINVTIRFNNNDNKSNNNNNVNINTYNNNDNPPVVLKYQVCIWRGVAMPHGQIDIFILGW